MKEKLIITVYKKRILGDILETIVADVVYDTQHDEVIKEKITSNTSINDLFDRLVTRFGAELKFRSSECYVEIINSPGMIIGEAFYSGDKYTLRQPLNFKDLEQLTFMLNELVAHIEKLEQAQKAKVST